MKDDVRITRVTDTVTRKVKLAGMTDIMFDRYPGDNTTQLEPYQKLYLEPGASRVIGLGTFRGVFGKFRVDSWD